MNTRGMEMIGRGAFSTVYKKGAHKVLIKSTDNAKECMAMGWFPSTPMFPKTERVGFSECGEFSFYQQKLYRKVSSLKKSLKPFEWEFYRELRKMYGETFYMDRTFTLDTLRNNLNTLPPKFHHKKRMLLEAVDALSNYGSDVCFEISPRNVAVQGGCLILLDCFFFFSELDKVRSKRKRS